MLSQQLGRHAAGPIVHCTFSFWLYAGQDITDGLLFIAQGSPGIQKYQLRTYGLRSPNERTSLRTPRHITLTIAGMIYLPLSLF